MAGLIWYPTVVLGGPVRPTGAVLLSRDSDGVATVHTAGRLDDGGASEDDQVQLFIALVDSIPPQDPRVTLLARAAGVGRLIELAWADPLRARAQVRSVPLTPSAGEGSDRAREDLVAALHLARSRRQLVMPQQVAAAVDVYMRQAPAAYGQALDPYDADPDGIAVPTAVAVHYSDPTRQTTVHAATGYRIDRRAQWPSAPTTSPGIREIGLRARLRPGLRIRRPWP